jgi:lysophospholipase L1-like esterase
MPLLPTNVDVTYADSGGDATVALHQQHHDQIHAFVNGTSKRATQTTGSADAQQTFLNLDYLQRIWFQIPVTSTQWRLRICNQNARDSTIYTTPMTVTGVAIGSPLFSGTGRWTGVATATMTQVYTSQTVPTDGTDLVTAWTTNPAQQITARTPFMLSVGIQSGATGTGFVSTDAQAMAGGGGTGQLTSAAGTASWGISPWCLDIRIEYDYQAQPFNLVGFYIGDSGVSGFSPDDQSTTPQAGMLPHENYPGVIGLNNSHTIINAANGTTGTTQWLSGSSQPYTRIPSTSTTVPDYAWIGLGSNDCFSSVSLATYQTNMAAIVSILRGMGIKRIFTCTVAPRAFTGTQETLRLSYNDFLRAVPLGIEAVHDFDKIMRSPSDSTVIDPDLVSSDGFHPNRGGAQRMGNAVIISP